MKTKRINRKDFLEFLLKETGLKTIKQQSFTGKNIYYLADENTEQIQIEFIPKSKKYFFTILIRGIEKKADFLHDKAKAYIRELNTGRDIIIDTETKTTLI